jgi:hypothetical protein
MSEQPNNVRRFTQALEPRARQLLFGGGSQRWSLHESAELFETEQDPGHTETTVTYKITLATQSPLSEMLRKEIFNVLHAEGITRIGISISNGMTSIDIDGADFQRCIAPKIKLFGPGELGETHRR